MRFVRPRHLQLFVTAVVMAAAIVPGAAHAAAVRPTLSISDSGVSEVRKWLNVSLWHDGDRPVSLRNVRMVVDTAELSGFADLAVLSYDPQGIPSPAKYCTTAGTLLTCDLGDRSVNGWLAWLTVQARPGAALGRSGRLKVTVSADGLAPLVATPKITVAEDVDLAVRVGRTPVSSERGRGVTVPIQVVNMGQKPVGGVVLRVEAREGLRLAGRYTNCGYRPEGQEVYCRFAEQLAAGATYGLSDQTLAVRVDAPTDRSAPFTVQLWTGDDAEELGVLSGLRRGNSGVLRLVPRPVTADARAPITDSNSVNNVAYGSVRVIASPTATTSPSASATVTPSASAPPSAGGGATLPVTGVPAGALAAAGGLLTLGGIGLLVARRRRARFVA